MKVIAIMVCALAGSVLLLFLAGTARWSLIYLIRYRLLKREVNHPNYEISRKRDVIAVIISFITLIVTAILLIYGVPFVAEHYSELPILK